MTQRSLRNSRKGFSIGRMVKKKKMLLEDCIKVQQKIKAILTETEYSK